MLAKLKHRRASRLRVRPRLVCERLEDRTAPANVTTYHNDVASTGVNANETLLSRANVNSTTFGKVWQVQVQGQVYAQPLVLQGVNITVGGNQGIHDVVFVATQHDQLYAYDAANNSSAVLLWQRDFLDIANVNNHLPGATALTAVPQSDVISPDITVEIGITGTPVIDPASGAVYVITKTKETVGGVAHWVQRLHKISAQNGSDMVTPFVVGDTRGSNTNTTPIYVYGNGNGSVIDPYNGTGLPVVQFNALRENQRPALTLVNGVVYTGWASHGDNGPYHGWMVGFDAVDLHLRGALNTTPNGGLGGIWMAGGALSFDETFFYFETGNGTFDGNNGSPSATNTLDPPGAPGPVTGLNAQGFPVNANYGDSFVKVALDPTTTPQNQNVNGWGLKVVDYFTPLNQAYLNAHDLDVGSSACVVVPDSYGSTAHPHLLVGSGKEGVIYLMDRDNMGKYGIHNNIVQNTSNQLSGSLDTAAIYNGRMYYVEGYGGVAKTFTFANGAFSLTPETQSPDSFAFAGSTPSISANGLSNGIVWDIDRGTNQLRAYSSDSYAVELYTSAQAVGGRDALGAAVKFQVVTVANGHVFCGAGTGEPNNRLVVYGLLAPPSAAPNAPSNLAAQPVSSSQINLSWTNNAVPPNSADSFYVEQSPDGTTNWTPAGTTAATTFAVGGLNASTTYFFRVRAHNVIGFSGYSNVVSATTGAATPHSINFPNGFTGGAPLFTFNGYGGSTPIQANGNLRLTNTTGQARSAFFNALQNIVTFSTTFTFTKNGLADGATFVVQRDPRGLTALGEGGGNLGYGAPSQITPSFALAFNFYSGHAIGTELLTNGNVDYNYTQQNINVASDNSPITATITYAAGFLSVQFTQGTATEMKTLAIDLPALLGGATAYVGFTGATGGLGSTQEIVNWTFDQGTPPATVTGLTAQVTGYTATSTQSVPLGAHLTWTAAAGAVSYKIERKLTINGTYQQIGTSTTTSFDDTGLTPNSTYYYHVRATNAVGDGAFSTEVPLMTPALAPTPTNGHTTTVTTTSVGLAWTDNANNEDGFQIFRSVNGSTFSLLTALPPNTIPAPSTVMFNDKGLTPGNRYDYHIIAFNLSGYSDFAGITTQSLTLAPAALAATATPGAIVLTWQVPFGAVTYNVYRGTTPNGQGAAPIATGLTMSSYTDSALTPGTTYYYKVTAVNLGGESARSNEAFVAPPRVQSIQIDDGTAQRSRVASVTVNFNTRVILGAGAFQISGFSGKINVDTSGSTSTQTIAKLTFMGGGAVAGSLADGNYELTVFSAQVTDLVGQFLDGDNNGQQGGDAKQQFFRLFGDSNGDRHVDIADFGLLSTTYGLHTGQTGFLAYFDYNGDGVIDIADFGQFSFRMFTFLAPP